MHYLILCCLLFILPGTLPANCCEAYHFENARFEVGYNFGRFIGIRQDYTELGLFLPFNEQNDQAAFIDGRAYRLNDGHWGSSVGVGFRKEVSCESILGTNIYYDYLRGKTDDLHRLGFGVEWLTPCWDARLNGYFPLNGYLHHSRERVFDYGGNFVLKYRKNELVFKGLDAEIGLPLYSWCSISLYAAAGPYYFHGRHTKVYGGQGRLELNWDTILSLECRMSFDNHYHTNAQGRVVLSLPLEYLCNWSSCWCGCHSLFTQPVRRTGLIFTKNCCDYKWNW